MPPSPPPRLVFCRSVGCGAAALVGEVDYGIGVLKDADGSTIASITRNGEVSGHYGARCGRLDGFDYSKLRVAAAYLALLDKSFIAGK